MLNKIKNNKGVVLVLLVLIVIIVMNIGSENSSNESELDESLANFYKKEEVSPQKLFVSIEASGLIEAISSVEIKSKASGEVPVSYTHLRAHETGAYLV